MLMPDEAPAPRIEEALSYMERDIDHIGEQLMDLWTRLETLERRVRRVEKILDRSEDEAGEEGEDETRGG